MWPAAAAAAFLLETLQKNILLTDGSHAFLAAGIYSGAFVCDVFRV